MFREEYVAGFLGREDDTVCTLLQGCFELWLVSHNLISEGIEKY